MVHLKHKIESLENFKSICDYLPKDHSKPCSLHSYLKRFYDNFSGVAKVLDLGCGRGESIEWFLQLSKKTQWHGVDIENSPEVKNRTRENASLVSFNGLDLPYPDSHFDLIFSNQVLEHVRYPDALVTDALRVLKPGGHFVGSVSYLEPYHSYSIFNFTPYGIVRVFSDAGFELKEIRPETDTTSLVLRQFFNKSNFFKPIWKRSMIYGMIAVLSTISDLKHRELNFLKVQFSGHLVFLARRAV